MQAVAVLNTLTRAPQQHPDCCCSLSLTLLDMLIRELPEKPALILSCGAGTGLLEQLTIVRSHEAIDIYGVEVPSCANKYLSEERMLRVQSTRDVPEDALLAEALIFCYPRNVRLVEKYLTTFAIGALHKVIVLTHRDDYPSLEAILVSFFDQVSILSESGLPEFEVFAVATNA